MAHRPKRRKPSRQTVKALARIQTPESGDSDLIQLSGGLSVGFGEKKTIVINAAQLTSPSHLYDADFAWVEHRPGSDVSLFFAKANRDAKDKLKSRLQIRYPPEDFARHFWKNSRTFHENVRRMLASWPVDAMRKDAQPAAWVADKDHSEWVNFDYMAFAGTQAALDFYHLGPGGVARYIRGQGTAGLELQAVVRVQMTLFELGHLLDLCQPIVDMINTYLPTRTPELLEDQSADQPVVHDEGDDL